MSRETCIFILILIYRESILIQKFSGDFLNTEADNPTDNTERYREIDMGQIKIEFKGERRQNRNTHPPILPFSAESGEKKKEKEGVRKNNSVKKVIPIFWNNKTCKTNRIPQWK